MKLTEKDKEFLEKLRELTDERHVSMCPDVVCGECYNCRHVFAYSWCENWRGYGNSFRATDEPLLGGWSEYMVILSEAFVYSASACFLTDGPAISTASGRA